MTEAEKRNAAKKFVRDWSSKGDEKQDTQRFWIQLLREVMGVDARNLVLLQAYGFWGKLNSEPECVAEFMKMYQALTAKEKI